ETKPRTVAETFSLWWGRMIRTSDRWQWQSDPDLGYTVRGTYHLLTTIDSVTVDDAEHLIWHPQVPLKVFIFAWRLCVTGYPQSQT
ncbi:O-acyltransferase WSD1, partial [Trifolium pratense]